MLKKIPELVSRLTIGYVFIESGYGKLMHLDNAIEYFQSLKIPFASVQAPFASATELLCGLAILLGVFTRLASVPLIVIMIVALVTAKAEDITDFSSLLGTIEFLYIVILIWLAAFGSQAWSVDQWRHKKKS